MNKRIPTPSKSDPFLTIFKDGKPPEFRKNPLHPELPSLFLGRLQRWGTSLTSMPDPARTLALAVGREEETGRPLFGSPSMPVGRPKAGKSAKIAMRGENPMQPEKPPVVAPGRQRPQSPSVAKPRTPAATTGHAESRQHPMQPEKPPSVLTRPEMVGSGPTMTVGVSAPRPEVVGSSPTMTVGAFASAGPVTRVGKHPMQPEKPPSVLTRPEVVGLVPTMTVGALAGAEPVARTPGVMTESADATRAHLRVMPGEGPASTSHSADLGKVVDVGPPPGMTRVHGPVRFEADILPRAQNPGKHPMQPEKPPTITLLRNGNRQGNPNNAPRCCARTRLGCACRSPAMKNGRCRMHGGASTGARTPEGRARIAVARTIHGGYGAEARAYQAHISAFLRRGRVLCAFARADMPFEALTPLIGQALGTQNQTSAEKRGKTPCNQKTADTMLSLMTLDLSARQASTLTGLIRVHGKPSRPPRKNPIQRENRAPHPASPASATAPPVGVAPVAQRPAAGNTPCNQKPNRATRRRMAKLQRRAERAER